MSREVWSIQIKRSINTKIMLGYAAMLIVIGIIGTSMYVKSTGISMKNQAFVDNTLPLLRLTEEATSLLNNLHMAAFAYYGTTITNEDFDERYTSNKERLNKNLAAIKLVIGDKHTKTLKQSENLALIELNNLKQSMSNSPIN